MTRKEPQTRYIQDLGAVGYCCTWMRRTVRSMAAPSSFENIKDLKFIFTLGSWMTPFTVPGGTANTITMQGLRASVSIDHAGGADMGTMNANIYGLSPSQLNQLT